MSSWRWLVACGCAVGVTTVGWRYWKTKPKSPTPRVPALSRCSSDSDSTPVHTNTFKRCNQDQVQDEKLWKITEKSRLLVKRAMLERGIPGAVVAVSKNGEVVWSEGFGYADIENDVYCSPDTVMRIASISKPLTAVALLQLWQKRLVDLDAPVQNYVPEFPHKTFDGKPVDITTRMLLSHLSGIRHYANQDPHSDKAKKELIEQKKEGGFEHEEFYITSHFNSVEETLQLFADDDLVSEPGKEFNYTTHGWTLVSAVIERASGDSFLDYMQHHIFEPLGMTSTMGEFHQPLVYHRARHYVRNQKGYLKNTPYVDNSYKWAGGGFISNAKDLVRFGNAVLACYQLSPITPDQKDISDDPLQVSQEGRAVEGVLDPATVVEMWKPVVTDIKITSRDALLSYGLGWIVQEEVAGGRVKLPCVGHTGSAVGATSVLLIVPQNPQLGEDKVSSLNALPAETFEPCGVVVAVIFNLQGVSDVFSLGVQIAREFL